MAKTRPSGDGMVRKREDGRWEGRIVVGHKENGDPIFRYIYADTQKELTAKLRQNITAYQGVDLTEECRMTLSEWLDRWLAQMASVLRPWAIHHHRPRHPHHPAPCAEIRGRPTATAQQSCRPCGAAQGGPQIHDHPE